MATIEEYHLSKPDAEGKTQRFRVRYRKPNGRQTDKRGFKRKTDARNFLLTVEGQKLSGDYIEPKAGRTTVTELSAAWLDKKRSALAPSGFRTVDSAWRTHVKPRWGASAVADIEPLEVEAWIVELRAKLSAPSVIRAHGVLAGILGDAVKARRIRSNPARGIEGLPRPRKKRHVYLTADDVHRLADESGKYRPLVLTLAYTGVRWSEATALRVRDIDTTRARLNVYDNAVQEAGHVSGPTKGRVARSVPVPGFVLEALTEQIKGREPTALVFGDDGRKHLPRPTPQSGWFDGAIRRAGVQRITPHDLRHSCASLAVSAGANVLALARMLGHDPAMCLRTYADLFDSDLDAVAASIHNKYGCGQNVGSEPETGDENAA